MFIRRILKLSSSLTSLSFPSQNVFAYHLSHVENLKGTSDVQDHIEDNGENLKTELKSLNLSKVLCTLYSQNDKQTVQGSHIVTAMSTFYHLAKREINDQKKTINIDWSEHIFYKEICSIIKTNISKISGPETVQILYYIKKLKGSPEIQKVLIEHLNKNLKELSLEDFRMILSLFQKSKERSKYFADIEKAIIKNFIIRVSMNHEKDNIEYLANGLYLLSCCPSIVFDKLLNLFVKDLCNYKDDISIEKSIIILESLCSLTYFPREWLGLLKKIQKIIMNNIDALQPAQINYILFAIQERVQPINGIEGLYDAVFIDTLVQKLVCDDVGYENALSALKCLNIMRHYNKEILNYLCASYFDLTTLKNKQILNHRGKLSILITGLANAKYKSVFWNELENYITKEQSLFKYHHLTLSVFTLHAICLDCYPTELLKKLFDGTYDFSKDSFSNWTLSKIYQKIKTNPSYKGPLPTESQIDSINTMFKTALENKKNFPMLSYLEQAMGGRTYVKTNLGTKLFNIIDHVVAFDKNGLPIPLNSKPKISEKLNDIEYLEELNVPEGSKIFALIFTPNSWYFRNTNKLIGPYGIFVNTLESMKCNVVDIHYAIWKEIPDKEKTNFVLSKIKSKLHTCIMT